VPQPSGLGLYAPSASHLIRFVAFLTCMHCTTAALCRGTGKSIDSTTSTSAGSTHPFSSSEGQCSKARKL
jgi:hypothetical protein